MKADAASLRPGDSIASAVPKLLRLAGVGRVTVEKVSKAPSFRGGTVSERARAITGLARDEHQRRGFGFWEFALERSIGADASTRQALLRGALIHDSSVANLRTPLSVDELAAELAQGAWEGLPARTMVNLCSTVSMTDGRSASLVLLDFGLPASVLSSLEVAIDVVDALGVSGALFTSGRSFHFVSGQVAEPDEMRAVLARAQLLSPLIDARWVSHQLIDGESRLRISTDVERNPVPHRLVHVS